MSKAAQQTYFDLLSKKKQFDLCSEISTLAIGSSHADYGFNPEYFPGSFNFCHASQDLKASFHVLKYGLEQAPHIKKILLYFSIFSPGFMLERSNESVRCAAYHKLFDFPVSKEDEKILTAIQYLNTLPVCSLNDKLISGFHKTNKRFFFDPSFPVLDRVNHHLKYNIPRREVIGYLDKIISISGNSRLYVIIPPVSKRYMDLLPNINFFKSLEEREVKFLNLMEDPNFSEDLFGDFDHLKPEGEGPKLLTERVLNYVKQYFYD
jgi:hypothetical protein